jgi:hypothetical protein
MSDNPKALTCANINPITHCVIAVTDIHQDSNQYVGWPSREHTATTTLTCWFAILVADRSPSGLMTARSGRRRRAPGAPRQAAEMMNPKCNYAEAWK